jgi:hypothetical protein
MEEHKHTLIQRLVSRIPAYQYPVNEKAAKRSPQRMQMDVLIHQSVHVFKVEGGIRKVGKTYRRAVAKEASKRDTHRNQIKEK